MKTEKILEELTELNSVSGFENQICDKVKKIMKPYCDDIWTNRFNSVICYKGSRNKNRKKLMIEAHLDQIGLIVTEVDKMGFIKFMSVGGLDKRILPGSEAVIYGKEKVYGIIGSKPPHLAESSDKKKMPDISELLIDTGYSKEEAEAKISVGNSVVLKSELTKLQNENYCCSALDNRAGITAVIKSAIELDEPEFDIYYVFSSEEELGLHGAYSAAREIKPDYAIVIDVTHGMTPDTKDEAGVFKLGCGAVLCKGPALSRELAEKIIKKITEYGIKYDVEVVSGNSGTNSWAVKKACGECQNALISIPLKYMHTGVEMINILDIEEVAKLLNIISKEGI